MAYLVRPDGHATRNLSAYSTSLKPGPLRKVLKRSVELVGCSHEPVEAAAEHPRLHRAAIGRSDGPGMLGDPRSLLSPHTSAG